MEWYHVWRPWLTSKRVARFVSDSWVSCLVLAFPRLSWKLAVVCGCRFATRASSTTRAVPTWWTRWFSWPPRNCAPRRKPTSWSTTWCRGLSTVSTSAPTSSTLRPGADPDALTSKRYSTVLLTARYLWYRHGRLEAGGMQGIWHPNYLYGGYWYVYPPRKT